MSEQQPAGIFDDGEPPSLAVRSWNESYPYDRLRSDEDYKQLTAEFAQQQTEEDRTADALALVAIQALREQVEYAYLHPSDSRTKTSTGPLRLLLDKAFAKK
jgi:hypothetical protein